MIKSGQATRLHRGRRRSEFRALRSARRVYLFYTRLGTVHLFQGRVDEAILWLERARRDNPSFPAPHWQLAAAYGLKGDTARAKAELAEAHETLKRHDDDRFRTIALLRKNGDLNTPPLHDSFEQYFIAGLRKAGMPEE